MGRAAQARRAAAVLAGALLLLRASGFSVIPAAGSRGAPVLRAGLGAAALRMHAGGGDLRTPAERVQAMGVPMQVWSARSKVHPSSLISER